ncbi:uncharacterized protein ACNLHF_022836 [Anomaloglossus baeobatrachus]|uniref:uncharacterized protein LOC142244023 n=1 Tax=Anomaloglossus baeobatrachus TaxID=238106 RepID=UPI003F50957A
MMNHCIMVSSDRCKHCSMGSSNRCKKLLASLDLLSVSLLEDSIPGIVSSFELGVIKTMTSDLIKHLRDLDGQDLMNALLFLSTVSSVGVETASFLTSELIDQTYRHMRRAESKRQPGITGAAMTLLANIAIYSGEEVMERLEKDEEHPPSSSFKVLDLISTKSSRDWKERSYDFFYHLLHPMYGFRNYQDDFVLFHDTDTTQAAMCHYITCVLTDEERRKLIPYLRIPMRYSFRTSRITSVMFVSELLHHPNLEKNVAKNLISLMALKTYSSDELEVCHVTEAIGNACKGAPTEVHQLKDFIFDCLRRKLYGCKNPKDIINILQVLSKLVTLLKRSKLGNTFGEIVNLCTCYLNHSNPLVQVYAASLFADLAKNCNQSKKDFSQHIRSYLAALLIMLHSKNQQVKAASIAALLHCLPYVGCKNVEELLNRGKYCKIYEQLGQKEPVYLVKMIFTFFKLLFMVHDLDALLEHLTMIRDALPYEELYPTALCHVFKELRALTKLHQRYPPKLKEAINRAIDILAKKWKSIGTVKVVKKGTYIKTEE